MSLYDGLSVETAPVPELIASTVTTTEDDSPIQQPTTRQKKNKEAPLSTIDDSPKNEPQSSLSSDSVEQSLSNPVGSWSSSNMKLMASQMMRQQMAASRVRRGGGVKRRGPAPPSHVWIETMPSSYQLEAMYLNMY